MDGRNDTGRRNGINSPSNPSGNDRQPPPSNPGGGNPGGDGPSRVEIESDVGRQILQWAAGKRFIRLARFNVGLFFTVDMNRKVHCGVPGCADYLGILKPSGRVVAIETKHPRGGRHTIEQRAFKRTIESFGGIYILARSVADVEDALK